MKENFLHLCRNKLYTAMVGLTAVCSYGFLVTHQTVGIDDTPYAYYFEEGLNVIVGRWFLFLLNKVFHVSEFTPFLTDLAGVLLFMAAVTVWCALLRSICGDRVPVWGYAFFSCIFLSCPLIAEVYTYYLHNGVSVGYLCTGLSLYYFKELTEQTKDWKKALWTGMKITSFLVAALGCYAGGVPGAADEMLYGYWCQSDCFTGEGSGGSSGRHSAEKCDDCREYCLFRAGRYAG